MTKIRNSWLQRAIILLRKRFPVALVLSDFKVWNWPNGIIYLSTLKCVKQYTTRIVSFCSRKKWCLLQVDTRFVNLMQMMYLLFAISIRLQAVTESFCLNDEGKILCKRKRMLYRAVAWPPKMRMYYWQLLDFSSCPRHPWVIARGRGGEGVNRRIQKLPKSFLFPKRLLY